MSNKDLAGKKLVFTAGSLEAPFLDAFLAQGGLKREQVELLSVEASAKATSYLTGRGDGVFSTVPFFLPIVAVNRPSDAILFSDYGLQFPSFGLLSSDDKVKARGPDNCSGRMAGTAGPPRSSRSNSSTSKAQRDRNGCSTAARKAGPARNAFAPHWVS